MAGEQLRVTEGGERGKALRVDADLQIGRGVPDAEGRLGDDPLLSQRHARISRRDTGQLTVEDLGSTNGTFVNDERIGGLRALELGDLVRVGHTVLQVTDASGGLPGATQVEGALTTGSAVEAGDQLLVTEGMAQGRRLSLGDELLVGRAMGEEGRLGDDPNLSRRHARVARDPDGRLTVEDLGSANGTFVNDARVSERRRLAPGDSIRVGKTTLEVVESTRAPERPPLETWPTAPVSQPTAPESHPTAPEPTPRLRSPSPRSPSPQPSRPPAPRGPNPPPPLSRRGTPVPHRQLRQARPGPRRPPPVGRPPRRRPLRAGRWPRTSRSAPSSRGAVSRKSSAEATWESSTAPRNWRSSAGWRSSSYARTSQRTSGFASVSGASRR